MNFLVSLMAGFGTGVAYYAIPAYGTGILAFLVFYAGATILTEVRDLAEITRKIKEK